LVSVIIPVYNRERLIKRAIDSVTAQTFQDLEIIGIDDGSTDNSRSVMNNLAATEPRIQILSLTENRGVSAARNLGINAARGEWICFLDSDDTWSENKLTAQLKLIKDTPECKICHTDEIWIRKGKRVNPMKKHAKPAGDIFLNCLPLCPVSPSTAMIHKSVFEERGFFDEDLPACEDYDLWLRFSAAYPFFLLEDKTITRYGGHPDQLSAKFWGMDRFRLIALLKIIEDPLLSEHKHRAVKEMIVTKANILAMGFAKREKIRLADMYRKLAQQFQG